MLLNELNDSDRSFFLFYKTHFKIKIVEGIKTFRMIIVAQLEEEGLEVSGFLKIQGNIGLNLASFFVELPLILFNSLIIVFCFCEKK